MNLEFLRALCGARGISGDEGEVRGLLAEALSDACTLSVDPLGNLIAVKKGRPAPKKLVLFAHMDEVGLLVTRITEEGLLRFSPIGIDSSVLHGRRVRVGNSRLCGVIGAKALHHLSGEERGKTPKAEELFIDIGASSGEEAARYTAPGDAVTFDDPFTLLGDGYLASRALDDRIGCALLAGFLLSDFPYEVTGVFTCGEESSLFGATAAANALRPDIAVILETTTAGDMDTSPPGKVVCSLGRGPVISFADRGTLYDRALFAEAFAAAEKAGIPVQTKEGIFGGNEARVVSRAGAGVRVCALSTPCRYLHSASVVAKISDCDAAEKLLPVVVGRFLAP